MVEVAIPTEFITSFKKFAANFEWANENFNLVKDHVNEYVAVADKEILGFAKTIEELQEKFGNIDGIYIDLITPELLLWIL